MNKSRDFTLGWVLIASLACQVSAAIPVAAMSESGQMVHDIRHEDGIPERFRLPAVTATWRKTETKESGAYRRFGVTFPSPVVTPAVENNTVHCEYYRPRGDGPFPAVIVLHILGGDFELSRICCRTLASKNIAALFLKMPYYGPRRPPGSRMKMISSDPQQSIANMTQAVKDIRRAADWLSLQDEVDANRLGITGISLGGIVASLSAGVEPRFQRSVFVLAGGDFAKIVAESVEMDDVRADWKDSDITAKEVGELLAPIDPLTYAQRLRDRKVLMINAKQDEVIPRQSTLALWKAAGEQELIWWNAGHYSAALFLPAGMTRIVQFFQ